jgi:hypothetical protein
LYAQEDSPAIGGVVGLTSNATDVSSTSELPSLIQASIADIFKSRMGNIADSLTLSAGQILHFNNVRGGGILADSSWVVPMYDLRFRLSDATLGITSYDIELRVDHKGRLLYLNWPESGYSDRDGLASWPSVFDYAMSFAKRRKFYSPHYQVRLRYNAARAKMVWVFQFPVRDLSSVSMLHTIEIDWKGPELAKEYMDKY